MIGRRSGSRQIEGNKTNHENTKVRKHEERRQGNRDEASIQGIVDTGLSLNFNAPTLII
jgi:hypothetical protein